MVLGGSCSFGCFAAAAAPIVIVMGAEVVCISWYVGNALPNVSRDSYILSLKHSIQLTS